MRDEAFLRGKEIIPVETETRESGRFDPLPYFTDPAMVVRNGIFEIEL